MATFDPSGAARQLPFRRGAMSGVQRIVRYRRECALPHSYADTLRKRTYTYRFPYTLPLFRNVRPPPTRRGRRPRRPLGCHIIWRYMGGETLLTRCRGGCPHPPSRRQARNGGEDGWFVQPTFSQTAAQGRAGTPAPTTRLGRVRNLPPSVYVSSPTICREVGIVIPTFSVVPRKGRRGRRPLRVGARRRFQQPYNAVPDCGAMAHRGRCALRAPHNVGKAARRVTGRLTLSNCQREVSLCQRAQPAAGLLPV